MNLLFWLAAGFLALAVLVLTWPTSFVLIIVLAWFGLPVGVGGYLLWTRRLNGWRRLWLVVAVVWFFVVAYVYWPQDDFIFLFPLRWSWPLIAIYAAAAWIKRGFTHG